MYSFFSVPIVDGIPDVDFDYVEYILQETGICYVKLRPGFVIREGWQEITEDDFNSMLPEQPEPVEPEPTEQEIVNAELLLGQAQLLESQAAIEETVAIILLETVGGAI